VRRVALKSIVFLSFFVAISAQAADQSKLKLNKKSKLNQYIVVYKEDSAAKSGKSKKFKSLESRRGRANLHAGQHGLTVKKVFGKAINGFVVEGNLDDIKELSKRDDIEYIEQDAEVFLDSNQVGAPWGLDRIDQRSKTLNGIYSYDRAGTGVNVYVVDSGIRMTHDDFGTRASNGWDFDTTNNGDDCFGHGTHVAGTIGGTTYGVAKSVDLIAVRVFDCVGGSTISRVIDGFDWVAGNAQLPAVLNASLGVLGGSTSVDNAVQGVIDAGVTVVVSAGNSGADACNQSPARLKDAITVGATDQNDMRRSTSNYGQCVDVWAPGENILSADEDSDTGTETLSGTSMAAPHMAGIAALYLQGAPNAAVQSVVKAIMGKVTTNRVGDRKTIDTPNLLAYSKGTAGEYAVLHRYYNKGATDHFYTTNWWELQSAPNSDWAYEGPLGYVQTKDFNGSSPLYRYNHASSKDHFYTTNYSSLGIGHSGWVYEGVTGYLPPASSSTKDVYRYYNQSAGDHLYSTNWNALGSGNSSWLYEGVTGQVFTLPQD